MPTYPLQSSFLGFFLSILFVTAWWPWPHDLMAPLPCAQGGNGAAVAKGREMPQIPHESKIPSYKLCTTITSLTTVCEPGIELWWILWWSVLSLGNSAVRLKSLLFPLGHLYIHPIFTSPIQKNISQVPWSCIWSGLVNKCVVAQQLLRDKVNT